MKFKSAQNVWSLILVMTSTASVLVADDTHSASALRSNKMVLEMVKTNIHVAFVFSSDEKLLEMVKTNHALIQQTDNYSCTALHYAARYGRVETARWLIEHKADVNTVAYNNFRPMDVVTNGTIASLLIKAGARLDVKDSWGKTPLQKAAQMGHTDVCEAILASGYPLDLSSAIRLGKRDAAKKMIKEQPGIVKKVEEERDLWGNTSPLGVAASQGDREMVELLLKAGAPVNAATERPEVGNLTPLCNAVWAGHYEVAEILCNAGADCNVTGGKVSIGEFYPRLLDYALKYSDKKMIDLLVKHGAKPSDDERLR